MDLSVLNGGFPLHKLYALDVLIQAQLFCSFKYSINWHCVTQNPSGTGPWTGYSYTPVHRALSESANSILWITMVEALNSSLWSLGLWWPLLPFLGLGGSSWACLVAACKFLVWWWDGKLVPEQSFSSSSDAMTNSWLGNMFSIGSSSAEKGPRNPGGQVTDKLALHPCNKNQLVLDRISRSLDSRNYKSDVTHLMISQFWRNWG